MELLVSLIDKGDAIDALRMGEVITIQPDGWGWSQIELTHPNAQIISAPILDSHAQTLMRPYAMPSTMVRGVKYPQKAYLLDLSKLPHPELFQAGQRTQSKVVLQNADVVNATVKVNS
jgi:hypothetical protein